MEEQSDTPRTEMAEGQGLNPYFDGLFDGESDELCALRLTLARERDEARAALAKFLEWLEKDEAGPQYSMPAGREGPDGEAEWRRWWHGQLDLCAQSLELARKALAATEAKP